MVNQLAADARKTRWQWLARGVSSHVTRIYCGSLARDKSVAICGYPRSGTSWVSAVLARYYFLPVPRHYHLPQLYPQVLHGHDLRLGGMHRVFYMARSPYQLFPSLFVKRYGITNPSDTDRARFARFLETELSSPHESPLSWVNHIAAAYEAFGSEAVMIYDPDPHAMATVLSRRIADVNGTCDHARLTRCIADHATSQSKPTTVTSGTARAFDWFNSETDALLQAELEDLHHLCPRLDLSRLKARL
ncbi:MULTISPECIES: hypothetical protein [unclassified Ruegeria]|uniref:hypothetical protein n=1 Tax=unclassified Ruegeria TaxID=2625375 RepID=UPI00148823BC|nr:MULTISPECIES: hypothetical protein [unclassified Ruegeria]